MMALVIVPLMIFEKLHQPPLSRINPPLTLSLRLYVKSVSSSHKLPSQFYTLFPLSPFASNYLPTPISPKPSTIL